MENDTALDWLSSVGEVLTEQIRAGLSREDYLVNRSAAEVLITAMNKGLVTEYEQVDNVNLAISQLNIMVMDNAWLNSWTQPDLVEKDIKRQLGVLYDVLNDLDDEGFDDGDAIVGEVRIA